MQINYLDSVTVVGTCELQGSALSSSLHDGERKRSKEGAVQTDGMMGREKRASKG